MATWDNAHGLRGSDLEAEINHTISYLRDRSLCVIQKVPTPITPVNMDKETRHITLAYFGEKSTVDYVGVVQGVPVCFDAKECAADVFPLRNIHEHQIKFMEDFEIQEGVAFLVLKFTSRGEYYYMTLRELRSFIERRDLGGRKSFVISELTPEFFMEPGKGGVLPLLTYLQRDLEERANDPAQGM